MITLHDVEQGTPEWHRLRAKLFTGSGSDKLLKFGTIDYSLTETGKFRGNYYTKRGHILEAEAIDLYEQIKGGQGFRFANGNRVGFVTNSLYPAAGYSPDDIYPDRTVEVKAFEQVKHLQMFNGIVPFKVLAQCHFGMFLCERPLCDLLIYNPELEPAQAFKIITIRSKANIRANFKRILAPKEVAANAV